MSTSIPTDAPDASASGQPDAPDEDGRHVAALAGQLLHHRTAFRSPRPGGRIDGLDAADGREDRDATTPDHSEEDDAG